ncbi:hypothetical protein CICLE_v10033196mg [Citrus x clementina]|uniref:Uncharacterized protein n=1 Tax=Citrus clementina TaxID=85681 RepID=V4STP2_CITCL|nr:hypothetical protein CICLE_v10033196mg [Citrus x clementina]
MAPMNLDTITTEQTAQASSGSRHFCVSYVIFQRRRSQLQYNGCYVIPWSSVTVQYRNFWVQYQDNKEIKNPGGWGETKNWMNELLQSP